MKQIPLLHGLVALVSDTDYARVRRHHWIAHFDGWHWYAHREILGSKPRRRELMHRFIVNVNRAKKIDHRDRNGLNNQRRNLRIATHLQNLANCAISCRNKSGFKGVSWKARNKRWVAQIHLGKKVGHLGLFLTKEEAARAYDKAAIRARGSFALTNKKLGLL